MFTVWNLKNGVASLHGRYDSPELLAMDLRAGYTIVPVGSERERLLLEAHREYMGMLKHRASMESYLLLAECAE